MISKKYKLLIGAFSSLFFVAILLHLIDIKETAANLQTFDYSILFYLIFLYLIAMVLRAKRWHLLLKQNSSITFIKSLHYLTIGYLFNSILPLKSGEIIRVEYVKKIENVNRSYTFGTIFLERMCDIIIILLLLFISVIVSETVANLFTNNYVIIGLIILFMTIMLYVYRHKIIRLLIEITPKRYQNRIATMIKQFTMAFKVIEKARIVYSITILSIIIWTISIVIVIVVISGLKIDIPYYAYLFIVSSGVLGMVIPSTSSNIGVYHSVAVASLLLFNVPAELALSFAIIIHALDTIFNISIGSISYLIILKST